MTRFLWLLCVVLTAAGMVRGADPAPLVTAAHYRVYRGDGTAATLEEVVAAAQKAAVTLVGESHDDPVGHHLELELLKRLAAPGIALSLEMFERDVQGVVDEYLAGLINEEHLKASGRAWKNYASDYKPLIELAKERKLPVIAANAPRRYVTRVSRLGAASLDALGAEAKRWLAPLPYAEASPAYAEKFHRVMEEARRESEPEKKATADAKAASAPAEPKREMDPVKALAAQSLWDATMAYAVAEYLTRHPGARVVHMQGSFHGERRLGMPEHLLRYRPGTDLLVVTMLPSKGFPTFDGDKMRGAGDFVIVTDAAVGRGDKAGGEAKQSVAGHAHGAKGGETKPEKR